MQEWLALCRKGQDVSQTPMGFLCRGRKLDADVNSLLELAENDQSEERHTNEEKDEDDENRHATSGRVTHDLPLRINHVATENIKPEAAINKQEALGAIKPEEIIDSSKAV